MEHLQRVWLASRERLPLRTPGSVPLSAGLACALIVETTFPRLYTDLITVSNLTYTELRGFHGAFATGVASQQGALTLPDTWFRPPFWDLLMLQLLRPNSSNLPCLYSTFHLEYPLVLSRFYLLHLGEGNFIMFDDITILIIEIPKRRLQTFPDVSLSEKTIWKSHHPLRFISTRKSVNNRYQSMSVEVLFMVPFEHHTYLSAHMMHIKHVLLL